MSKIPVLPKDITAESLPKFLNQVAESGSLALIYVPIRLIPYWEGNFKKHDIGKLWESIAKYGFRDPFAWDKNLNGGKGGVIEGNGRKEALDHGFKAKAQPPRGITEKDGEWFAPLLVGIDAKNEKEAIAYGIDHNASNLAGSEFSAIDIAKLFEQDDYLATLQELAAYDELPLMVDGDDLDLLLGVLDENEDGTSAIGAGDQSHLLHDSWRVLVECKSEVEQQQVLDKLIEDGHECRALIS